MKLIKLLIAFAAVLSLAACGKEEPVDKSNYKYLDDIKAVDADMSGYQGFTDTDHVFKQITFKESLRFFDEEATGVVLYGYSSCSFCTQVVPVLNEVAKSYGLTVYYVNVHGEDKIADSDIERYLMLADEVLEHDEDGNAEFYVPQIFVFVNGEIVGSHLGVVDSYDPANGNMSSSQRKELTGIIKKILKPLR